MKKRTVKKVMNRLFQTNKECNDLYWEIYSSFLRVRRGVSEYGERYTYDRNGEFFSQFQPISCRVLCNARIRRDIAKARALLKKSAKNGHL